MLFILFLLIAGVAIRGGASEEGASEREILKLSLSESEIRDTGVRVVYVCADISLYEAGGGGVVALGMGLELSEGWSADEVTPLEGVEGMTVTVGMAEGGVRVLLDGVPPELDTADGGVRLLRVTAVPIAEETPFGLRIHMTDGFYYIDGGGEICYGPVGVGHLSTKNTDDMTCGVTDPPEIRETTGNSDDIIFETSTNNGQETTFALETAVEPEDDEADIKKDRLKSVYIGCQETPVEGGGYAVRFLFSGETPVVCAEGGGLLSVEIAEADVVEADGEAYRGTWSLCTFRGLRAEGDYLFWVYTEDGVICISYRSGEFQGQYRK